MSKYLNIVAAPLVLVCLLLVLWHLGVYEWGVPNYVLPPPDKVLEKLIQGYVGGAYWHDLAYTTTSMAIGYLCGCGIAFVTGILFAEFRWVERAFYPFVLALQSMPKVALAPLILIWFGYGLASKAVMVALVCFFPIFVNTVVGLKSTDPLLIDLMRAFSAGRFRILVTIKIPSAAGHVFAGLQISIVLGLIGAVVAEFVSSAEGLGYLINAATTTLDTATMFAALFSLAVLGIGGSQLVRWLQRRLVFWDRSTGFQKSISE